MPNARWRSRSFTGGATSRRRKSSTAAVSLARAVEPGKRHFDQLALDARALEALPDPSDAPAVKRAPVLREQLRVAGIVEVALLADGRDRPPDRLLFDTGALEARPQLGHAVLALGKLAVAEPERVCQRLFVRGGRVFLQRYAARMSPAIGGSPELVIAATSFSKSSGSSSLASPPSSSRSIGSTVASVTPSAA